MLVNKVESRYPSDWAAYEVSTDGEAIDQLEPKRTVLTRTCTRHGRNLILRHQTLVEKSADRG